MFSRGLAARQAVTSTTESPKRTRTAPSACLASLPVSKERVLEPICSSRVCIKRPGNSEGRVLLADSELADQVRIALRVLLLHIVEQPPPLADQLQQTPPRVMVFRVALEVLGQVIDALAEDGHLHFRRAGVGVMRAVGANQFGLPILRQGQVAVLHARPSRDQAAVSRFCTIRNTTVYLNTTTGCKAPGPTFAIATSRPDSSTTRVSPCPGRRPLRCTG